jgi:hypothetical protein
LTAFLLLVVFSMKLMFGFLGSIKGQSMATQVEALQKRLDQAIEDLGQDAPFVNQLRQQLQGYASMAVNRRENFLIGAVNPETSSSSATDESETEEDAIRAEAIRRSQVRRLMQGRPDPSKTSSPSQNNTPEASAPTSSARPPTSK